MDGRSGTTPFAARCLARAVAGARHLMGLGYPVHFLAVLSTSPRQPSRVFEMAAQVGVRHGPHASSRVAPLLDSAARTLGPQALKEAYLSILRESAKHKISSSHQYPLFHLLHPGLGRSGRFWEGLVVDYQGKLLASSRSRLRLGDVREKGLEKLFGTSPFSPSSPWRDQRLRTLQTFSSMRRGSKRRLGGTGDYFGRDPGCWLPRRSQKARETVFVNWNSFLNKNSPRRQRMNPESKSKSIRVAMIGSWGSIHPALQSNFVASQILQNQFEPLVGKGDHGEWVPGAARSWTTSPDGRAVEFAIDTTRRFSDGSHLKAGDFKRSWEDALKVHKDSSQSSLREVLSQVVGFEEFPVTGRLSGVTAPSKDVLRVQFKTSFRMAIEQLHGARYGAYKSNESDGPVIGTGRYVMTESGAGQLNLEPNPHHPDFAKLRSLQVVAISASEVPSGLASGKWDCVFNTTGSWLSPEAFSVAGVEALRGEEAMHSVLHVNGTSTRLMSDAGCVAPCNRFSVRAWRILR